MFPVLPRLDCTTAKRYPDTNCIDVEMIVDYDEKHVSSNNNSWIGFVKPNNIQSIINNKLDNKIILKPMPFNDNIQLDTIAKYSNDCSKTIDHLKIEPMDLELIKSDKTTNAVVVKLGVKENDIVTSKIKYSNTYGIFPTDVLFLSWWKWW